MSKRGRNAKILGGIYVLLIIVFATIYHFFLPNSFCHTTIKYESSFIQLKNEILQELQDFIKNNLTEESKKIAQKKELPSENKISKEKTDDNFVEYFKLNNFYVYIPSLRIFSLEAKEFKIVFRMEVELHDEETVKKINTARKEAPSEDIVVVFSSPEVLPVYSGLLQIEIMQPFYDKKELKEIEQRQYIRKRIRMNTISASTKVKDEDFSLIFRIKKETNEDYIKTTYGQKIFVLEPLLPSEERLEDSISSQHIDRLSLISFWIPNSLNKKLNEYLKGERGIPISKGNWFRMFYLSTVTITTLGYGDIVPISWWGRFCITIESIFGLITLGLFLYFVTKKH